MSERPSPAPRRSSQAVDRERTLLDFAVSRSPAIFYVAESGGEKPVVFIGSIVETITGHKPAAFLADARYGRRFIHPDDSAAYERRLTELVEHGAMTHEYRFRAADGRYPWFRDELRLTGSDGGGARIDSEVGVSSYVAGDPAGETVDVAVKGVSAAYGGPGDDTLKGDAGDNWLAGGLGSDTLIGGAGNDVLLIDPDDDPASIDAGDGLDYVQVIGSGGVVFVLDDANVEVATGADGSDVLIGGGFSNVFIRGGKGDDLIVGGAADDAGHRLWRSQGPAPVGTGSSRSMSTIR